VLEGKHTLVSEVRRSVSWLTCRLLIPEIVSSKPAVEGIFITSLSKHLESRAGNRSYKNAGWRHSTSTWLFNFWHGIGNDNNSGTLKYIVDNPDDWVRFRAFSITFLTKEMRSKSRAYRFRECLQSWKLSAEILVLNVASVLSFNDIFSVTYEKKSFRTNPDGRDRISNRNARSFGWMW